MNLFKNIFKILSMYLFKTYIYTYIYTFKTSLFQVSKTHLFLYKTVLNKYMLNTVYEGI